MHVTVDPEPLSHPPERRPFLLLRSPARETAPVFDETAGASGPQSIRQVFHSPGWQTPRRLRTHSNRNDRVLQWHPLEERGARRRWIPRNRESARQTQACDRHGSAAACHPARAIVNPPNSAGALLSGWPSSSAHSSKICSRLSGEPESSFKPCSTPKRTVTLLPSPRARGTSPEISQRKENGRSPVRRKNAAEAASIIASASFEEARLTVIQL